MGDHSVLKMSCGHDGAEVSISRLLSELLRAHEGTQYEMVARFALIERGMLQSQNDALGRPVLTDDGKELVEVLCDIGRRALE